LESVQSIFYALSLPNVSFSPVTFIEIAAALPLVGFSFYFIFVFVVVLVGFVFFDDLTMVTFVMAAAALDWVFVFFVGLGLEEHCTLFFPVNASFLAMLDTRLLVDCKDDIFDSFE
jgi:hypothetical protein